ncbi:hypothetical protein L1987_25315 [Smallanthus sonchifolius]|uniref:Uncharacterized protein n=1 Tax=Smallanthus sonchifolius TaxID=185202 RepID=A0ACB9IP82_9ASTR|nr:hypothetical protein L1987_25315 [Smallanthus sonchifolius]
MMQAAFVLGRNCKLLPNYLSFPFFLFENHNAIASSLNPQINFPSRKLVLNKICKLRDSLLPFNRIVESTSVAPIHQSNRIYSDDKISKPNLGFQADLRMINRLCKSGSTIAAVLLLREMENNKSCNCKPGCMPDAFTFNIIIQGFLRWNETKMAIQFLRRMLDAGFSADAQTSTNLVKLLSTKKLDNASKEVLKNMEILLKAEPFRAICLTQLYCCMFMCLINWAITYLLDNYVDQCEDDKVLAESKLKHVHLQLHEAQVIIAPDRAFGEVCQKIKAKLQL